MMVKRWIGMLSVFGLSVYFQLRPCHSIICAIPRREDSPVAEHCSCGRKFSQLVPDHLLHYLHWQVVFSIMDHELQSDKVGDDGAGAGFCVDGCAGFEGLSEGRESSEEWTCLSAHAGAAGRISLGLTFPGRAPEHNARGPHSAPRWSRRLASNR